MDFQGTKKRSRRMVNVFFLNFSSSLSFIDGLTAFVCVCVHAVFSSSLLTHRIGINDETRFEFNVIKVFTASCVCVCLCLLFFAFFFFVLWFRTSDRVTVKSEHKLWRTMYMVCQFFSSVFDDASER